MCMYSNLACPTTLVTIWFVRICKSSGCANRYSKMLIPTRAYPYLWSVFTGLVLNILNRNTGKGSRERVRPMHVDVALFHFSNSCKTFEHSPCKKWVNTLGVDWKHTGVNSGVVWPSQNKAYMIQNMRKPGSWNVWEMKKIISIANNVKITSPQLSRDGVLNNCDTRKLLWYTYIHVILKIIVQFKLLISYAISYHQIHILHEVFAFWWPRYCINSDYIFQTCDYMYHWTQRQGFNMELWIFAF